MLPGTGTGSLFNHLFFSFSFFFTIKLSSTVVSILTNPESTKHEGEHFSGILFKLLQPEWAELPLIT